MPYTPGNFDSSHLYLQWGGKLPGSEVWSCGLRMAITDAGGASNDPAGMIAAVTAAVQAFHVDVRTQISPRALLSFVKLNYIDPTGHYAEDTTYQSLLADIPGGGTVGLTPPNQVAWAVSLVTGYSRGPAHRGRFFIPLPTVPIDVDGRVTTGTRAPLAASAEALRVALNAVDAGYKVAVFSRKLGAPAHRLVTGVQVGRVLDTQRRRRNKLAEAYA
jgi:hypothetical protein